MRGNLEGGVCGLGCCVGRYGEEFVSDEGYDSSFPP
jgi:hypothetical protein